MTIAIDPKAGDCRQADDNARGDAGGDDLAEANREE